MKNSFLKMCQCRNEALDDDDDDVSMFSWYVNVFIYTRYMYRCSIAPPEPITGVSVDWVC